MCDMYPWYTLCNIRFIYIPSDPFFKRLIHTRRFPSYILFSPLFPFHVLPSPLHSLGFPSISSLASQVWIYIYMCIYIIFNIYFTGKNYNVVRDTCVSRHNKGLIQFPHYAESRQFLWWIFSSTQIFFTSQL